MTYDRRGEDRRTGGDRRQQVLAQYMADISSRLRGVCAHLSEEEFTKLVTELALMRIRHDEIEDKPGALTPIRSETPDKP